MGSQISDCDDDSDFKRLNKNKRDNEGSLMVRNSSTFYNDDSNQSGITDEWRSSVSNKIDIVTKFTESFRGNYKTIEFTSHQLFREPNPKKSIENIKAWDHYFILLKSEDGQAKVDFWNNSHVIIKFGDKLEITDKIKEVGKKCNYQNRCHFDELQATITNIVKPFNLVTYNCQKFAIQLNAELKKFM